MATRVAMRAGQAVRGNDLMKPLVVQRNEPVSILYEIPGIVLTVRGKAVEAGAVGDMINVLNVQSNRTVQATVTGPGRVSLTSATPLVAAAQPSESADQTAGITQ
jgi:flagella basal body P-ring formation protein FlgA